MLIAPDASYSDGLLDIVIVENTSKWELIKTFPLVFNGKHTDPLKVKFPNASPIESSQLTAYKTKFKSLQKELNN